MDNLEMANFSSGGFFEDIERDLGTIQNNIRTINSLQTSILSSTSTYQESQTSTQRDALVAQTRKLVLGVRDRLKNIATENARWPPTDPNLQLRRQRHAFLSEKFSRILDEYRTLEGGYMKQQKARMARQYKVVNPQATQAEIDNYVANSSNEPIFQQALAQTGAARDALVEVRKRHDDIKQIESTIAELAQLFEEMQFLVDQQDAVVVDIEQHVESTVGKIDNAQEQLDKARASALSARKK
ncbi:7557_t:CDS:1, partial [Paraglomus occultum]